MKKNNVTCPYCGRQLNFSEAIKIKTQSEFVCFECGKSSMVRVNPDLQKLALALYCAVAGIVVICTLFVREYLIGSALIIALFSIFYMQVPRHMSLLPHDGLP